MSRDPRVEGAVGPAVRPRRPRYILAFHQISWERYRLLVGAALRRRHVCTLDGCSDCGRPGAGPGVAITFDDGVAQSVEVGAEGTRQFGWPVTFYLPTAYLDGEPLWQEVLTILFRHAAPGEYTLFGRRFLLPNSRARDAMRVALVDRLRTKPECDMSELMAQVRQTLDPSGTAPLREELPMPAAWSRIAALAGNPRIEFGSHTVTHRPLIALTSEQIEREFIESKTRIECVTGRPVRHFCYPFGRSFEIGDAAQVLAGRYFDTAVTLHAGVVRPGTPRSWLPRIGLYPIDRPSRLHLKMLWAFLRR